MKEIEITSVIVLRIKRTNRIMRLSCRGLKIHLSTLQIPSLSSPLLSLTCLLQVSSNLRKTFWSLNSVIMGFGCSPGNLFLCDTVLKNLHVQNCVFTNYFEEFSLISSFMRMKNKRIIGRALSNPIQILHSAKKQIIFLWLGTLSTWSFTVPVYKVIRFFFF